MAEFIYDIKIDIQHQEALDSGIRLNQGDFGDIIFRIVVLNNGYPFNAEGSEATINFAKPDGQTVVGVPIEGEDGMWSYQFIGNELQAPGKVLCDMKFAYENGRVSTSKFTFYVEKDISLSGAIASSSYIAPMEAALAEMMDYQSRGMSIVDASELAKEQTLQYLNQAVDEADRAEAAAEEAEAIVGIGIATTETAGIVKPDGNRISVDPDGTISVIGYTDEDINDLLEYKEETTNKVAEFGETPSDDKYPSEKLVKDSLDRKANSSDVNANWQGNGYNLIPFPYNDGNKTTNGITYTVNSDGSVTANGTATATAYFYCKIETVPSFVIRSNKRYFLSGCPNGGAIDKYFIQVYSLNAPFDNQRDFGNGLIFTVDTDTTDLVVRLRVESGQTVNNLIFRPMIVEINDDGTYPTEYQRYANGNVELSDNVKGITGGDVYSSTHKSKSGVSNKYDYGETCIYNNKVYWCKATSGVSASTLPTNTTYWEETSLASQKLSLTKLFVTKTFSIPLTVNADTTRNLNLSYSNYQIVGYKQVGIIGVSLNNADVFLINSTIDNGDYSLFFKNVSNSNISITITVTILYCVYDIAV